MVGGAVGKNRARCCKPISQKGEMFIFFPELGKRGAATGELGEEVGGVAAGEVAGGRARWWSRQRSFRVLGLLGVEPDPCPPALGGGGGGGGGDSAGGG